MQPVGRDNRAGDREGGGADPGCHLAVDVEDVESAGDAHDLEPSPEHVQPGAEGVRRRRRREVGPIEPVAAHPLERVHVRSRRPRRGGAGHGARFRSTRFLRPSQPPCYGVRYAATTVSSERLERELLPVALEPAEGRLAQAAPRLVHADDRGGEVVGRRRRRDEAVDALLDQLDGGVVRAGDDDARRAVRRRLDDDEAVALAPRRKHEAERRAERLLDAGACATNPGTSTASLEARVADQPRAPRGRSGPSPRISPRRSGIALPRASRSPERAPARASRGCGGRRRRPSAGRPAGHERARARLRTGRAGPSARRGSPPRAAGARAAARSRTPAAGCARRAAGRASRPRRATARGTRASSRASRPRASRRRAGSARAAAAAPAASSEKYGNEAVWTTS